MQLYMSWKRFLMCLGVLVGLGTFACTPEGACLLHSDCQQGLKCQKGLCVPPSDGGGEGEAGGGGTDTSTSGTAGTSTGAGAGGNGCSGIVELDVAMSEEVFTRSPDSPGQIICEWTMSGGGSFDSITFKVEPNNAFMTFGNFVALKNGVTVACQDSLVGPEIIVLCSLPGTADAQDDYRLQADITGIDSSSIVETTATQVVAPDSCPPTVDSLPYVVTN